MHLSNASNPCALFDEVILNFFLPRRNQQLSWQLHLQIVKPVFFFSFYIYSSLTHVVYIPR